MIKNVIKIPTLLKLTTLINMCMNNDNINERRPLLGASNYSADRQGNIYGPRGNKLVQGTNGWA